MTHTEVRYAGADSQASSFGCPSPANDTFSNEAAVLVLGNSPSTQFLTESIIADSAGDGVVRGWTGAEIDFLATNSFLGIARCNQTYPKPESGVCSENLPCPK
jgi:hypothetical protein